MSPDRQDLAQRLLEIEGRITSAREVEDRAALAWRQAVCDTVLSVRYGELARGKNKVLQAERDAWVDSQTQAQFVAWQEAKSARESLSDRARILGTVLESL